MSKPSISKVRRMRSCPAEDRYGVGKHLFVRVYERPLRRSFRKTFYLRCWKCDLKIEEP